MTIDLGQPIGIAAAEVITLPQIMATNADFEAVLARHLTESGLSSYGKRMYENNMRNHWRFRNSNFYAHGFIVEMLVRPFAPQLGPSGPGPEAELAYRRHWEEIEDQFA